MLGWRHGASQTVGIPQRHRFDALKIAQNNGSLSQMRIWRFGRALILAGLIGAGCGSSESPDKARASAPSTSTVATQAVQLSDIGGQAQPKLRTLKLWLGREEIITELAMSNQEITNG